MNTQVVGKTCKLLRKSAVDVKNRFISVLFVGVFRLFITAICTPDMQKHLKIDQIRNRLFEF